MAAGGGSDDDALAAVPGFATGGRVERTGIALIHEGEYVVPAPGSEAVIGPIPDSPGGPVLNFYFPIEIEVVGEPTQQQKRSIADHVYSELMREFAKKVP